MTHYTRVSQAVRANEAHPCSLAGCTNQRVALRPYCRLHAKADARNGHPTAPAIREALWRPYRGRVRAILEANTGHLLVTSSLQFLEQWLSRATALDGQRGQAWAAEVARLVRHGVSALDLLTELCAAHVALQEHPGLTHGDDHRAYTISKAVCLLAPMARRVTREAAAKGTDGYAVLPRRAALRHIGSYLTQALAPLLANITQTLQEEEERAAAEAARMRQPLAPSRAAIERALLASTPPP